jgi:hypothetical protein
MKLFRFHNPQDRCFARAGRLGTWFPDPGPGVCPECGASQQTRVLPLVIEWLPGSETVGDFVWPGGEVVVSQRVREMLEGRFQGFEFQTVEMRQDPKLKRPTRITRRTQPRVWLPYNGPSLYELVVTAWVHADLERSTIRLVRACSTCGYRAYEVEGVEKDASQWDPTQRGLAKVQSPRQSGRGIFVPERDLRGADVFQVFECPGWVLCTNSARTLVETCGFSNVSFLEVGCVFD